MEDGFPRRDSANAHRTVHRRPPPPAAQIHRSPSPQPAVPPACRRPAWEELGGLGEIEWVGEAEK